MRAVRWPAMLVLGAALLVWGCADNELTMTEYVERLQGLVDDVSERALQLYASERGGVLEASGAGLDAYTPQDLQWGLEQVGALEAGFLDDASALQPPESIADWHDEYFSDRYTKVREALADQAGDVASWNELSASEEMSAYRTAVADDKQLCFDFQADLHERAERGMFAGTPWVPDEVEQIFERVLGCDVFPEHPEDMWRP